MKPIKQSCIIIASGPADAVVEALAAADLDLAIAGQVDTNHAGEVRVRVVVESTRWSLADSAKYRAAVSDALQARGIDFRQLIVDPPGATNAS